MDETSLCLHQHEGSGTLFIDKKRPRPVQRVTRAKRRCCLTHVAFICDRPDVQPLLPQVVIGNERTFQAGAFADLQAACPANVRLLRQKSAWNNAATCAIIIRWLGEALAPFVTELQPVLLFDAVRLHSAPRVLAACVRWGVWPVLVPARITWLVQPLDTDAFLLYKLFLAKVYQRARIRSADGSLSVAEFVQCVCEAVRFTLQGHRWGPAFDARGFGMSQASLAPFVRRFLEIEGPLAIPSTRPSLEQFQLCYPRRQKVPMVLLMRALGVVAPPRAAAPVPAAALRAPRTRGDHRRAAAVPARVDAPPTAAGRVCEHGRPWGARYRECVTCRRLGGRPWTRSMARAFAASAPSPPPPDLD